MSATTRVRIHFEKQIVLWLANQIRTVDISTLEVGVDLDQLFVVDIAWQLCPNWLTVVSVQIWADLNVIILVGDKLNIIACHL